MSTEARPEPISPTPPQQQSQQRSLRPPLAPPVRKHSNPFTSTFHYFTDPLSYTLSSVARRLSEDETPTPLSRALNANLNEPMLDPTTGLFNPPKRRLSPFQPPPLTPLELHGYRSSTGKERRLLTRALAEEIRLLLPARLQLCDSWSLTYSLDQDGSTLSTLYSRCDKHRGKRGGFILVVRDSSQKGGLFGAYLSDPPKPQQHYYGSGECFLWRSQTLPALPDLIDLDLPPPPSEDTTHAQRMTTVAPSRSGTSTPLPQHNHHQTSNGNGKPPQATNGASKSLTPSGTATPQDRIRFKAFPYTGENDFSIYCQSDYLSVGAGDGHYGLWLDHNLAKGVSQTCPTYGNEALSDEGGKFDVLGVEVWFVGSSS